MKKNLQIELDDEYSSKLANLAKLEFRTKKSTVEKLVIEYIDKNWEQNSKK